ncbi:IS3 family transposase [Advenella sp.]
MLPYFFSKLADIRQYIHFYHQGSLKFKLKGLSPLQYQTQALAS